MSQGCWKGGFVLQIPLCLKKVLLSVLTSLLQLLSLILFHVHSKLGPADGNQKQSLLLLSISSHSHWRHNCIFDLLDFSLEVQTWMSKATSAHPNPVFQKLGVITGVLLLPFAMWSAFTMPHSKGWLLSHPAENKGKGIFCLKKAPPGHWPCSQLWTSTVLLKDDVAYQPSVAGEPKISANLLGNPNLQNTAIQQLLLRLLSPRAVMSKSCSRSGQSPEAVSTGASENVVTEIYCSLFFWKISGFNAKAF